MTTFSVLNSMKEFNVKKLVFTSSSAVYGEYRKPFKETDASNPVSLYGAAKTASESYVNAFCAIFGLQAVILRFANVVGPKLTHGVIFDFINKLRKNPKTLLILGDGKQNKPYIHTDDVLNAVMIALKKTGGQKKVRQCGGRADVFNVGGKTATSVNKIAKMLIKEMKLKNVIIKHTGGSCGWKGDVAKFQFNLSKISALGFKAKLTSDEAVTLSIKQNI